MMTPQEVAARVFPKATLGGYNMAMVDAFLDQLTEDYATLYNDVAILKNKLKILSDTVEEYRATDAAMRKTLLAAQKMADSIVADAEKRKAELVGEAEEAARARISELRTEIAAEEYRLHAAQESTAAYVAELTKLFEGQRDFLAGLNGLTAQATAAAAHLDSASSDIEDAMSQLTAVDEDEDDEEYEDEVDEAEEETEAGDEEAEAEQSEAAQQPAPAKAEGDKSDTRVFGAVSSARFDDLQFGKDYEITWD